MLLGLGQQDRERAQLRLAPGERFAAGQRRVIDPPVGAVRADFFTGWGPEAGDIAGRLKQNLRLWALWPK